MKLTIDRAAATLVVEEGGASREYPLYGPDAFQIISREWLRVGWNEKYSYSFSWLGRPVIQLPEDLLRMQETIFRVRPDVVIETGIAHGGSLLFYATVLKALGRGRVIGVDLEIRQENRQALSVHELAPLVTLVEGSSIDPGTIAQVRALVAPQEVSLVVLDSCHEKSHVRAELEAYCGLVGPGSYLVATDGIMRDLADVPNGEPHWAWDNPLVAAEEFLATHPEFHSAPPEPLFDESHSLPPITYWPGAWLRRS